MRNAAVIVTALLIVGSSNAADIAGLWGSEFIARPAVYGDLTIDGRGPVWRAVVSGFDVPVIRTGTALSFTIPGPAGRFSGRLVSESRVTGQWIQPATAVYGNEYATPVDLARISARVWRGRLEPRDERVSFYIRIHDGTAVIDNPELNWFHGRTFAVAVHDASITFTNTKDASNQFDGTYDPATDRLQLAIVSGAPPLQFTRRTSANAEGLYPRTPIEKMYTYRAPLPDGDGWTVGTLAGAGLDARPIAELVTAILGSEPFAKPIKMQSLLIARHGKLVLEEYFYGFDRERPHDMRSAGKTFAPMLVGLARDHGAPIDPDTKVYELFAKYKPFAKWDERKAKMRVQDLMSMTAGYDCDEDHTNDAPLDEWIMQGQTAQPDWYKYTLDAPMAHDPGGHQAYYCSPELNLAAGAAAIASKKSIADLFHDDFARPLQFRSYHLNLQPTGEAYMGGGAYIRPRDQLKLGQLYLNGGTWNGRRVLSADWVRRSLETHSEFEPRFGVDHQYGWGWHIQHLEIDGRTYTEYSAGGNGGQVVMIFPQLDMVVGFTGGAYGEFQSWGRWGIDLIRQYIIPAALPHSDLSVRRKSN
jgi:CubicO group peptidase (beta-lactamase class C family)